MSNRIGIANDLRVILGRHEDRAGTTLSIAIRVGESLREIFDNYVIKEIDDLRSQIQLLQQVGRELKKEENILNNLEERFEKANNRLNQMLNLVREGKITSLSWRGAVGESILRMPPRPISHGSRTTQEQPVEDFEIDTLVEGFSLLGEIDELRKDIERWSRTYIRDIDDVLSIVDERFRQLRSDE